MKHKLLYLALGILLLAVPTACEEDDTSIGSKLQDDATIFVGERDTIYGADITAYTIYDSNLRTSGYTTAMIGHYWDATFGSVNATLFTQVGLTGASGIRFGEIGATIDSVVVTLVVKETFPNVASANMRIKVSQLAERLYFDSTYTANQSIETGSVFFDDSYHYVDTAKTIRLRLGGDIAEQFAATYADQEEFQERFKGFCIQTVSAQSDPVMFTFNFEASDNKVTVYYTYEGESNHHDMILGATSTVPTHTHFCQFKHNYSGTALANLASGTDTALDGSQKLYLEPLGGMGCRINIDRFITRFRAAHPYATIHYAELLLPVADEADTVHPLVIDAYKRFSHGVNIIISDGLNSYTSTGYDGKYHKDKGYYRIRCTQHLQEMLREGHDNGTLLLLDERRSKAARTIINGPLQATNPMKICFVYSEGRVSQ